MRMLSFIIPAHNEQAVIGGTLHALREAALGTRVSHEMIVVDDASDDRTAEIAASLGARVVTVDVRNIGAARNAGAHAALGDTLVFVDADTLVPPATLAAAVEVLRRGAVAGTARLRLDDGVAWWARAMVGLTVRVIIVARWVAGCFLFVRRDAFEAVGGFNEAYFASEDIQLSRALKKRGRVVVLRGSVVTSGRKFRLYSVPQLLRQLLVVTAAGPYALRRREALGLWYDGRRESTPRDG